MNVPAALSCLLSACLTCSCALQRPQTAGGRPAATDFERTITAIERADSDSPALLTAQLAYADFLLSSAATGPCAQRLERAQEQLGSVEASPKVRVMFPEGWPRVADLEYRLHLARAACGSEADRALELRSAAAAALHAVELYRDVFDYHSMVVMQFDAASALHEVGDEGAARRALEDAIEMDREDGFRDDGAENYKVLLGWRGTPGSAAQVAALMQHFPQRRLTLKFAWHAGDGEVREDSRRECLSGGHLVASHAAAAFGRAIKADAGGGWTVAFAHRLDRYEPGVWPAAESANSSIMFPPAPLPAAFKVSGTGQFEGVTDVKAFAARLIRKAEGLIRDSAPSAGRDSRSLASAAVQTAELTLSPGMLEAMTAENYQLETAMWIGATLDQAVWYEISAPLSLPGMPRFVVQHRVEFAFTRMVPCTAGAAAPTCAELVLRAVPEEQSLAQLMNDMALQSRGTPFVHYSASMEVRIVADPATLTPYAREQQLYWYASIGNSSAEHELQSEHDVSMMSYTRR